MSFVFYFSFFIIILFILYLMLINSNNRFSSGFGDDELVENKDENATEEETPPEGDLFTQINDFQIGTLVEGLSFDYQGTDTFDSNLLESIVLNRNGDIPLTYGVVDDITITITTDNLGTIDVGDSIIVKYNGVTQTFGPIE